MLITINMVIYIYISYNILLYDIDKNFYDDTCYQNRSKEF